MEKDIKGKEKLISEVNEKVSTQEQVIDELKIRTRDCEQCAKTGTLK